MSRLHSTSDIRRAGIRLPRLAVDACRGIRQAGDVVGGGPGGGGVNLS